MSLLEETSFGLVVFVATFGAALVGTWLRDLLPEQHLDEKSEDVVKIMTGVVATMSALVIGLLLSSAKTSFDTKTGEVRQFASDMILLDRALVQYGDEARPEHQQLGRYARFWLARMWPETGIAAVAPEDSALIETIESDLNRLTPKNDDQRWLQSRALSLAGDMQQLRWSVREQLGGSIPNALWAIVVFWLAAIFVGFGVFTQSRNATVLTAIFICSLSMSASVFLILELDRPFGGVIKMSAVPMLDALGQIDRSAK